MQLTLRQEIVCHTRAHIWQLCKRKQIPIESIADRAGISRWSWASFMDADLKIFRYHSPGTEFFQKLMAINLAVPDFWGAELKRMLRRLAFLEMTDTEASQHGGRRHTQNENRKGRRTTSSKLSKPAFAENKIPHDEHGNFESRTFVYAKSHVSSRRNT